MILFIILALILLFLVIFTIAAIVMGGSVFILLFSDVIVCIFIIGWIMRKLMK